MNAREAFEVRLVRGGAAPAWLAGPGRFDQVEVTDLASGEVVFLWDRAPRDAARLARHVRESMFELDAEEFVERWRSEPA